MKVLITDNDRASASFIRNALHDWGHETALAGDMAGIWEVLHRDDDPLIAIIDCSLPGLDGLDLFRNIRATIKRRSVYLILLSTHVDPAYLTEALEAGANNYITRSTGHADLRICIETGRRLLELEEALAARSTRDTLTGLYNRDTVVDHLKKEMLRCQRERAPLSIVFTDLDRLQQINDRSGHLVGDAVLQEVSRRLGSALRFYDHLGRYGGDELLTILPKCNTAGALEVAERARMAVAAYPI
ncbi:diguanylate cyclase, partial [Noviherbaspirillum denitrificans]|uniref:diguanylate cyclase n=1 Tax=Noviherbaspirillum denitrificans TaxID=1968433 RepID=UPI00198185F9